MLQTSNDIPLNYKLFTSNLFLHTLQNKHHLH